MDGKWAWVTNSVDDKVLKIQRGIVAGQRDKVVAEVPTGPGPYGMRMSMDDKELWVADKGENGPRDGATITVIDAEKNIVKRKIPTNCIRDDHIIMSPDGREMWATCNTSHEIVVVDAMTSNPHSNAQRVGIATVVYSFRIRAGRTASSPRFNPIKTAYREACWMRL